MGRVSAISPRGKRYQWPAALDSSHWKAGPFWSPIRVPCSSMWMASCFGRNRWRSEIYRVCLDLVLRCEPSKQRSRWDGCIRIQPPYVWWKYPDPADLTVPVRVLSPFALSTGNRNGEVRSQEGTYSNVESRSRLKPG